MGTILRAGHAPHVHAGRRLCNYSGPTSFWISRSRSLFSNAKAGGYVNLEHGIL
jgi:hypothetical protein